MHGTRESQTEARQQSILLLLLFFYNILVFSAWRVISVGASGLRHIVGVAVAGGTGEAQNLLNLLVSNRKVSVSKRYHASVIAFTADRQVTLQCDGSMRELHDVNLV